jgi:hypothetical protein
MKKSCSIRVKKISALLTLLIVGSMAKASAEEVIGTILFEPETSQFYGQSAYTYYLDTTGDKMIDKNMGLSYAIQGAEIANILKRYLIPGAKVIMEFENPSQKHGDAERLVGVITADGASLDFTAMFSLPKIKWYFPHLYKKLVREGKV